MISAVHVSLFDLFLRKCSPWDFINTGSLLVWYTLNLLFVTHPLTYPELESDE